MSGMELADRLRLAWGSRSSRMLTVAQAGSPRRSAVGRRPPGSAWRFWAGLAVPLLAVTASLGWLGWDGLSPLRGRIGDHLGVPGRAGCFGRGPQRVCTPSPSPSWRLGRSAPASCSTRHQLPQWARSAWLPWPSRCWPLAPPHRARSSPRAHLRQSQGSWREQAVVNTSARAHQAEQLLAERVRADAERDKAAALAERNRLGHELHDVLAHSPRRSLGSTRCGRRTLGAGSRPGPRRELVRQARSLAVRGLEETRQAVHVLRDEPVELTQQLASLAAHECAELTVEGNARPLGAEAGLALYGAAQEALTNARKHAPGALVTIRLNFEQERVTLLVTNGQEAAVADELQDTGGGFGLQGIRERVELLGGEVEAGPSPTGWSVHVAVPA